MSRKKALIVEDEADIREVIEYNMTREGYGTLCASDGAAGLKLAREHSPDLVFLDLMLPEIDGVEVCRRLKADPLTSSIPIIMVTAKGEESDIVLGLGLGADDYIVKPFRPKELVARAKAVLRRGGPREEQGSSERVIRGGLIIDVPRHEVLLDGKSVSFTPTEFRLLYTLASHPGRVFTRDQLLSRVIGDNAIVIDRNIDVHVRAVRKKMGGLRAVVETIRGIGYRFRDESLENEEGEMAESAGEGDL